VELVSQQLSPPALYLDLRTARAEVLPRKLLQGSCGLSDSRVDAFYRTT
jgi:hypothetical protein